MSKSKAIFITLLIIAMQSAIAMMAYTTWNRLFIAMMLTLTVFGIVGEAVFLLKWLQEEPTEPQHLSEGDMWAHDDEYADQDATRGG